MLLRARHGFILAIINLVGNSCHDCRPGEGVRRWKLTLRVKEINIFWLVLHLSIKSEQGSRRKDKKPDMSFFSLTSCPHHAEVPSPGGPQLAAWRDFSFFFFFLEEFFNQLGELSSAAMSSWGLEKERKTQNGV